MDDSVPYLAFNIARLAAFFAWLPGLWVIWQGSKGNRRAMGRLLAISALTLGLICALAVISNSDTQADGWDTLGTFLWSGIGLAILVLCAGLGELIGRSKFRSHRPRLNE